MFAGHGKSIAIAYCCHKYFNVLLACLGNFKEQLSPKTWSLIFASSPEW
jgi:hypothetical protein